MKRILALTAIALAAAPAMASQSKSIESIIASSPTQCSENYFEELAEMYQAASEPALPAFEERMFIGRCFTSTCTDLPIAAAYLLHQRHEKDTDAGPIGKVCENLESASVWAPSKPANYYDHATYESLEHDVQFHEVTLSHGAWVTQPSTKTTSFVKANDHYLIEKLVDRYDGAFAYCYYFKAVNEAERDAPHGCQGGHCERHSGGSAYSTSDDQSDSESTNATKHVFRDGAK